MPTSLEYEYVSGQHRDSFTELLKSYQMESDALARSHSSTLDHTYGTFDRERYDLFRPEVAAKATLVYFHAGYWQSRDKSTFRFVASPYLNAGANFALANYPLCPTVHISDIVRSARRAICQISRDTGSGADGHPLIICGHSAGAHLCAELALTNWAREPYRPKISGIVGLSGIYDLYPLISTSLNQNLRLSIDRAATLSPLFRIKAGLAPALFAVGGGETEEFKRQSNTIYSRWAEEGNTCSLIIQPHADHFTILRTFADPQSLLHRSVLKLAALDQVEEDGS
jgi:arylformamidase